MSRNGTPQAVSRRQVIIATVAVAGVGTARIAAAQLVDKLSTIVTGFPAGGSSDVTARLLAEKLRGKLAPNVLVENRPGAGGRIALESLKGVAADGSHLLLSPQGMLALFPHIYRRLRYDPLNDFVPVTMVVKFPFVLALSPRVPATVTTLDDFIRWCKAQPADASFGSPGEGTSAHFAGVMLARSGQFTLEHVPYKGMAPLVQDLMGGQIAAGILTPADATPLLAGGRVRLVASTGAGRSPYLPAVPTLSELGHPSIVIEEMYGLFLPAGAAPATVQAIHEMVRDAIAMADVRSRFAQLSLEPVGMPPARFKEFIHAQHARWGGIVKATNFVPTE